MAIGRRWRRPSGPRRGSSSPRRSPTRWCAPRTSPRCARLVAGSARARRRSAWSSTRPSPRRGPSRRRCSIRASTSSLASGTKALGGTDRDLWGYVATSDTPIANAVMDLMAMRGGILDWRRAEAILAGLDDAEAAHARRSATATRVAAFLAAHPAVSEVFHPSLPDASRRRRHRRAVHAARLAALVPRYGRRRSPHASLRRRAGHVRRSSATRCRSTAWPPRSTTTRRSRSTSRPPGAAAQRLRPADPPGGGRRRRRRPDRGAQLDAAPRREVTAADSKPGNASASRHWVSPTCPRPRVPSPRSR